MKKYLIALAFILLGGISQAETWYYTHNTGAGGLGFIGYDGHLFAHQSVEQRGFAHVGATYDGYKCGYSFHGSFLLFTKRPCPECVGAGCRFISCPLPARSCCRGADPQTASRPLLFRGKVYNKATLSDAGTTEVTLPEDADAYEEVNWREEDMEDTADTTDEKSSEDEAAL